MGDDISRAFNGIVDRAIDRALRSDTVSGLLDGTLQRGLGRLEALALDGFDPHSVFDRFTVPVDSVDSIRPLGLRQIDTALGETAGHYQLLAAAQGAATGVLGPWGLPVDLASLFVLSARAVAAVGTGCGFDMDHPAERRAVLETLATPPRPWEQREVPSALAPAASRLRTSLSVSRNFALKEARQVAASGLADATARSVIRGVLGRLARTRIGLMVPLAGAGVGALINTRFMAGVLDESRMSYRQRYLIQRYGRPAVANAIAR